MAELKPSNCWAARGEARNRAANVRTPQNSRAVILALDMAILPYMFGKNVFICITFYLQRPFLRVKLPWRGHDLTTLSMN